MMIMVSDRCASLRGVLIATSNTATFIHGMSVIYMAILSCSMAVTWKTKRH